LVEGAKCKLAEIRERTLGKKMSEGNFLVTPERVLLRLRQRKRCPILVIPLAVLLLLVPGFFAAPHLRNAIRGLQARRHANRAFVFINQQKWHEARDEAIAAYQLRANEPQALRALARLLSRLGQGDALTFWKNLGTITSLTREDLGEEAGVALKANDLAAAEEVVQQLLETGGGKPTPAELLLAAEVSMRRGQLDKASELAQKALTDSAATRRDQLQATIALATIVRDGGASLVGDPKQIDQRLAELAKGRDDVALGALVTLAQRVLAAPGDAKNPSVLPVEQIIQAINNHPLAKAAHKLLAVDLEISEHSDRREEIERQTIDRWKNANNEDLTVLAAWLYRLGEYQRVIDVIPLNHATQTRELFLQSVDALDALGRWGDIREILENERFPLDPVIQNMCLARCYAQQGQKQGADNNWQRAIEGAAGDLSKLLMLGDYAERNGAYTVATTAYDAAAAASPKSRAAEQGRLQVAYAIHDTKRVHALLEEFLKIWPKDAAVQNDEAYARLLLLPHDTKPDSEELKSVESLAQKLVQEEPNSLPHRTLLALALLKQNRPYSAFALYRNFTVPANAVTASTAAVHAAVLAASGQAGEAQEEFKHIHTDKLLPEERALIANL
jgi:tetratricopeptide (TPR) repeat protein